jgi:hypothetical protein
MRPKRKVMVMGTRQKWVGTIVILAALLFISSMPGYAGRGRHEFRGHEFRGHEFRGSHHGFRGSHHGFRGPHRVGGLRVFIRPSIVVPFGLHGAPHWGSYGYLPVVITPSPRVYVQPSPPADPPPPSYWYYCEGSQAYYPYVQQCPRGWRPVTPTPP